MNKTHIICIIAVFIVCLLVSPAMIANDSKMIEKSDDHNVVISIERFDEERNEFVTTNFTEISLEKAEDVKNQLLLVEKEITDPEEKIRRQMEILHEYELLPDSMIFDDYLTVLNRMDNQLNDGESSNGGVAPTAHLGFIFSGPAVTSTLALGGQTFQLQTIAGGLLEYYFDVPLFDIQNDDLFNGTHLNSSAYGGPVYVGISPSSAFITTLGLVFEGPLYVYSPFVQIGVLFTGAHVSGRIFECSNAITVFDWHINFATINVIAYQDNVNPATPQNINLVQSDGKIDETYSFSTHTVDLESDPIYFKFNWDDGTQSDWLGPYDNFEEVTTNHKWDNPGMYHVSVKAKNPDGAESDWSDPYIITINEKTNWLDNIFDGLIQRFPFLQSFFTRLME